MILTRAQLRAEVRTLRALLQADQNMITWLRRTIAAYERSPALAANVRLAHQLEQTELELARMVAACGMDRERLARFMADHPHIFDDRS